ncbi:jasmonate-induced oxygenase 1-like [Musa acuminata AAA Group]|uniref:jasmonate-induced oxygenase 1-like n=1 Tax=Musa acuminata AAA Group TaxID=214697 RepID=UPI0031D40427
MDCLQEWPEPVVHVQALSDSALTTIPDLYIKPPSERPSSDKGVATPHIPVIDLGGLAEGAAECRATICAVADACRSWGFFQVVNHGVSPDLVRKVREVWRGFFRLPMAEKQAYANNPRTYEGYGSRVGVEKGAILDWGDYFYLHLLPESIKNQDKWPALPSSCRQTVQEYGDEMVKLCGTLMKVLSISLGLDVDQLQAAFGGDDVGACLRVNYYPRCPQPELTLGLSPHSDPGGLTALLADDSVKGLQVRRGDDWVTVQPVAGAFIVNIGDQIQILSNAKYKSVEHRVTVNAAQERLSLAFFYNPRSDWPIAPVGQLVTPQRPPLYQATTFDEYRMHVRKNGPTGKTQVESLKAI